MCWIWQWHGRMGGAGGEETGSPAITPASQCNLRPTLSHILFKNIFIAKRQTSESTVLFSNGRKISNVKHEVKSVLISAVALPEIIILLLMSVRDSLPPTGCGLNSTLKPKYSLHGQNVCLGSLKNAPAHSCSIKNSLCHVCSLCVLGWQQGVKA